MFAYLDEIRTLMWKRLGRQYVHQIWVSQFFEDKGVKKFFLGETGS